MIKLVGNDASHILESDEVDHVVIGIKVAFDLDGGAIVMAVDSLAVIAVVRDEMPGAKDQVILGDVNFEARG
jgi:hypothetical protein